MSQFPLRMLVLASGLLGQAWAGPSGSDQQEARGLRERGEILPLAYVLDHVAGPERVRVLHVEFQEVGGEYLYQVEFLDGAGTLKELRLDARTGQPARPPR